MQTLRIDSPLYKWLLTQPEEFVRDVSNNDMLGDGYMTIDKLRELDEIHNPED